jgi:pimeloyl-ACP methyl ester carboxylesterase
MARSRRRRIGIGLALAGAGVAAGVALRGRAPQWATGEDPCGPDGLTLPEGERRTVRTDDGAELDVLVAGPADGPTIVLAHCWTGDKSFWGAVARRLVAEGHRVVLYDQRGHGGSSLGTDPMTTDRLGEDLLAVLDDVGAAEVVLAGHSMGGMTIQALALHHPDVVRERVRGVVLAATAAQVFPRPVAAPLLDLALGDLALRGLAGTPRGLAATRGAVGRAAHRAHVEAIAKGFFGTTAAVRSGFLTAMTAMDYREGLGDIDVPTTVLVGTHDRLTPPRRARLLAERIPGAELVVLPGAGHMLPIEEPDRVAEAILARAKVLR